MDLPPHQSSRKSLGHSRVTKTARVGCCIPGCPRTKAIEPPPPGIITEWICARHWRPVGRATKALHRAHCRAERRMSEAAGYPIRTDAGRRIWARCKREAERLAIP